MRFDISTPVRDDKAGEAMSLSANSAIIVEHAIEYRVVDAKKRKIEYD